MKIILKILSSIKVGILYVFENPYISDLKIVLEHLLNLQIFTLLNNQLYIVCSFHSQCILSTDYKFK